MSVEIGPGYSVIVRKASMQKLDSVSLAGLGKPLSQDDKLAVFGPLFETQDVTHRLDDLGLVYFEDYFDMAHTGGQVPDWCKITLSYREPAR